MMAKLAPEFAIDLQEATQLAEAIVAYWKHTSYTIDPRTRDLMALIMTAGIIYVPRIGRVAARRKAEIRSAAHQSAMEKSASIVRMPGL